MTGVLKTPFSLQGYALGRAYHSLLRPGADRCPPPPPPAPVAVICMGPLDMTASKHKSDLHAMVFDAR
jgi:hypothetical protein